MTAITDTMGLLSEWVAKANTLSGVESIFIFGSLINDQGRDFQEETSDIDLVLVMDDTCANMTSRVQLITELEPRVRELEGSIIQLLHREASHPHVSVVCLTPKEAYHGIHKSGDFHLLSEKQFIKIDANYQMDTPHVSVTGNIDEPSFGVEFSDEIVAIRYAQDCRNAILSNSFNGKYAGLLDYTGDDVLPKKMLRTAAILGWKSLGEESKKRTDLAVGIRFVQALLKDSSAETKDIESLVDGRSLNRGTKSDISRYVQLRVSELMCDVALDRLQTKRSQFDSIISGLNQGLASPTTTED